MVPKRSTAAHHYEVGLAKIGLKEINASSLAHYTKVIHARATDGMLKGGFVLPKQNVFVPRTMC